MLSTFMHGIIGHLIMFDHTIISWEKYIISQYTWQTNFLDLHSGSLFHQPSGLFVREELHCRI